MDANLTMTPEKDIEWETYKEQYRKTYMRTHSQGTKILREWTKWSKVEDIWRVQNPGGREYSRTVPYREEPETSGGKKDRLYNGRTGTHKYSDRKHNTQPEIMEWKTDHARLGITMVGLPHIRDMTKSVSG